VDTFTPFGVPLALIIYVLLGLLLVLALIYWLRRSRR